jgi:hypothetical protein
MTERRTGMKQSMALILVVCFLGACGGEPTPAPDLVATQIAVEEAAHATMTAKAPTATPEPAETSTPTPTVTPSDLWETWESTALGFSVDYPATCDVSKNATGWQRFVDSGKWGMSITVRNKAAYPDDWGFMLGAGKIQAEQLIQDMVDAMDMSLAADFVLIFDEPIVDRPGLVHAWNTRYREKNYLGAVEVLILKSDTREWFFCFIEYGSEYRRWTVQAKDSITLESD